ncbi:hypothetical protein H0H81_001323 [Sphagnurus paluster]|uniref:Uncharacterized protein n=1 Tax=Sphagnurus paluster TaxID=117069 RepID=A0A9P7K2T8_9AGAR|nr:hypothetical protein H0H81_001323 [Sphagnurus paluster]
MRRPSAAAFTRPLSRAKSTNVPAAAPVTPGADENPTLPKATQLASSTKEARAWEHERQRVKKAASLVKSKARKAQTHATPWTVTKLSDRHSSHSASARALMDADDGPVCDETEVDWDDVASPLRSPASQRELERDGADNHVPDRPEVALTDFLISRKPRHGRGKLVYLSRISYHPALSHPRLCPSPICIRPDLSYQLQQLYTDLLSVSFPLGGRTDFEVVPPIRSVIVLDDAIMPDLDFDEPWEHVGLDDADEPAPSYAKIAALN